MGSRESDLFIRVSCDGFTFCAWPNFGTLPRYAKIIPLCAEIPLKVGSIENETSRLVSSFNETISCVSTNPKKSENCQFYSPNTNVSKHKLENLKSENGKNTQFDILQLCRHKATVDSATGQATIRSRPRLGVLAPSWRLGL